MGNSIVVKYDVKIMCPLLLQMYNHLNPTKEGTKLIKVEEDFGTHFLLVHCVNS
jgi:hypothetical protein